MQIHMFSYIVLSPISAPAFFTLLGPLPTLNPSPHFLEHADLLLGLRTHYFSKFSIYLRSNQLC